MPNVTDMRYIIIDFMHLPHKFIVAKPLSCTKIINGKTETIDTTFPNYAIKDIVKFGEGRKNFTAVCLEGGNSKRKEYFKKLNLTVQEEGYKGNRPKNEKSGMFAGSDMAVKLMLNSGVSLYRQVGEEADDMIYSLVQCIKRFDTVTPISVITNDSDMLPLVDDQVSVYVRGTRTYAEPGYPEYNKYFQVTPESWDDFIAYSSMFKKFRIPYNSMALFKSIRGDSTDNITSPLTGFGPKKYNELMEYMENCGVDFANVFRYDKDFDTVIKPVLSEYMHDEVVDVVKKIFEGIRLRYSDLTPPGKIPVDALQQSVSQLNINLGAKYF